ncbi:MAG: hypothetical protein WAM14_14765 [Candidatus Nitrosopolaris sp.]
MINRTIILKFKFSRNLHAIIDRLKRYVEEALIKIFILSESQRNADFK